MPNRIIVTLYGNSTNSILRDIDRVAAKRTEYPGFLFWLEFRHDLINANLKKLYDNARRLGMDVIGTVRHASERGEFKGTNEELLSEREKARDLGAKVIDVELDHFCPIKKEGSMLLVSHHNFEGMPDILEDIPQRMIDAGADICKFAVTPQTEADNDRVLGVVEQYCVQKPVIGIAMQQLGQRTRYQSLIRGAWGSYACLHPEKAIAGQMTVDQVVEKLRRAV